MKNGNGDKINYVLILMACINIQHISCYCIKYLNSTSLCLLYCIWKMSSHICTLKNRCSALSFGIEASLVPHAYYYTRAVAFTSLRVPGSELSPPAFMTYYQIFRDQKPIIRLSSSLTFQYLMQIKFLLNCTIQMWSNDF